MATIKKIACKNEASVVMSGPIVLEAIEPILVTLDAADYVLGATAGLINACYCPQLPALFSQHPLRPELNVVQFDPTPYENSPTDVLVKVRYVNMAPMIVVRGGCALEAVQTDMDVNRVPVYVSNQSATASPPVTASDRVPKPGVSISLQPRPNFVIQRVMKDVEYGGINPVLLQRDWGGRVNSAPITIKGVNFQAGTMICENVGYDNDGLWGVAWNMTFEFRYNPNGWNPEVVWYDSDTDQPGTYLTKDPNFDNAAPLQRICANASDPQYGRKVIREQWTADFTPLFV